MGQDVAAACGQLAINGGAGIEEKLEKRGGGCLPGTGAGGGRAGEDGIDIEDLGGPGVDASSKGKVAKIRGVKQTDKAHGMCGSETCCNEEDITEEQDQETLEKLAQNANAANAAAMRCSKEAERGGEGIVGGKEISLRTGKTAKQERREKLERETQSRKKEREKKEKIPEDTTDVPKRLKTYEVILLPVLCALLVHFLQYLYNEYCRYYNQ